MVLGEEAIGMRWPVYECDEAASSQLKDPCPVLAKLLDDAKAGKFQVVLCWRLLRFGRSVQEFIDNVVALNNAGVRFICTSQPFDTDRRSPDHKALMQLLRSFAEFGRPVISVTTPLCRGVQGNEGVRTGGQHHVREWRVRLDVNKVSRVAGAAAKQQR
jgi:site-specific DNA recombinase